MLFWKKLSALDYNPLDYIKQIQLKYFLLISIFFIPGFAHAADLFEIPNQDISVKILNALFGGLVEHNIGNKSDPILEPLKALNNGALIVGGVLAAYTILSGTIGTAHDGEVLGKKLSSAWVPIRYSIGTALVLPIIGGGYCVIQFLIVWVIVQGIGLAGSVWNSYLGGATHLAAGIRPSEKDLMQSELLVLGVLNAHACVNMGNRLKSAKDNTFENSTSNEVKGEIPYGYRKDPVDPDKLSLGYVYKFGEVRRDATDGSAENVDDVCGLFQPAQLEKFKTVISGTSSNNGYLGDNIDTAFTPIDLSPILEAHTAQMDLLVVDMKPMAQMMIEIDKFTQENADNIVLQARSLSITYSDTIREAALSITDTESWQKMQTAAAAQGWMLAGAWFTRVILINNSIRAAMKGFPTMTNNHNKWLNHLKPESKADFAEFEQRIVMVNDTFADNNTFNIAEKRRDTFRQLTAASATGTNVIEGESEQMNNFVQSVTKIFTTIDTKAIVDDERHPLILINEIGGRLSESVFFATLALGAGSAFAGAFLPVMKMFFGLPLQAVIVIALTAEFIIPNLPYIIWIGCVLGWALLVLESVIAAPLWAIMHLHPNGDELTGKGGNGYNLIISLIFRPTLMVFGMIGAILLSAIIGEFINKTFLSVFLNSIKNIGGIGSFLAGLMGCFLYIALMLTFMKQCFGIIHKLPDQLMRWIGGSTGGLGEMAGGFQESAEKSSTGAAIMATTLTSNAAVQGASVAQGFANKGAGGSQLGTKDGSQGSFMQRSAASFSNMIDKNNGITKGEDGRLRNNRGLEKLAEFRSEQSIANAGNAITGGSSNGNSGDNGSNSGGAGFNAAMNNGGHDPFDGGGGGGSGGSGGSSSGGSSSSSGSGLSSSRSNGSSNSSHSNGGNSGASNFAIGSGFNAAMNTGNGGNNFPNGFPTSSTGINSPQQFADTIKQNDALNKAFTMNPGGQGAAHANVDSISANVLNNYRAAATDAQGNFNQAQYDSMIDNTTAWMQTQASNGYQGSGGSSDIALAHISSNIVQNQVSENVMNSSVPNPTNASSYIQSTLNSTSGPSSAQAQYGNASVGVSKDTAANIQKIYGTKF